MNSPSQKTSSLKGIVIILLVTFSISALSLLRNQQSLDWSKGELSHVIAYNLYSTGKMFPGASFVARPPGYIYFMAGVFAFAEMIGPDVFFDGPPEARIPVAANLLLAIYFVQILVFGLAVVFLYLWARCLMPEKAALLTGLCFGINAYWLISVGLIHYAVLHVFVTCLAGYALSLALKPEVKNFNMVLAGMLWGIATLVRPVTLVLPFFVMLISFATYRGNARGWLVFNLLFILGMSVAIGPYTLRNYVATRQVIPVNAQAGAALWAATRPHPQIHPNEYFWPKLLPEFQSIYKEVTGEEYTFGGYIVHNLELEKAFKKQAWKNFQQSPGTYLNNLFMNIKNFVWGVDSVLITRFLERQAKEHIFSAIPTFKSVPAATRLFEIMILFLTVLSAVGGYFAVRHRDHALLIPVAIVVCYGLGHSATYLDMNYYYFKQPFLYLLSGYGISQLWKSGTFGWAWPRMMGMVLMCAIVGMSIVLCGMTVLS